MLCPDDTGECLVNFSGPPDPEDNRNYLILATDYTEYAIVYSCVSFVPWTIFEMVWILTRDPEPSNETYEDIK